MSNLDQIWVFVGLAGFILVCSCLFFMVVSNLETYSLLPERKSGQTSIEENVYRG